MLGVLGPYLHWPYHIQHLTLCDTIICALKISASEFILWLCILINCVVVGMLSAGPLTTSWWFSLIVHLYKCIPSPSLANENPVTYLLSTVSNVVLVFVTFKHCMLLWTLLCVFSIRSEGSSGGEISDDKFWMEHEAMPQAQYVGLQFVTVNIGSVRCQYSRLSLLCTGCEKKVICR